MALYSLFFILNDLRDWPTIPQLYVNGELVGGCDIVLDSKPDP